MIETFNKHQDYEESLTTTTSKSNEYKKRLIKIFNFLKFLEKKNDALITQTGLLFSFEKLLEILFFNFLKITKKKILTIKFVMKLKEKN